MSEAIQEAEKTPLSFLISLTEINATKKPLCKTGGHSLFITRRGASQEVRKAVKYLKDNGMNDRI